MLTYPIPPKNKIFSVILQHERQGNFASFSDDSVFINVADSKKFKGNNSRKYNSQGSNTPSGIHVCTFCRKTGHTILLQLNPIASTKEDIEHVENFSISYCSNYNT